MESSSLPIPFFGQLAGNGWKRNPAVVRGVVGSLDLGTFRVVWRANKPPNSKRPHYRCM